MREDLPYRMGLAGLGIFAFYIGFYVWQFVPALNVDWPLFVIAGGYVIGFAAIAGALAPAPSGTGLEVAFFAAFAALVVGFFYVQNTLVWNYYGTDSLAFSHYGADLLLHGRNPYAESMLPSIGRYHVPPYFLTPHVDGSFESRLTYPAFNFLVFVPAVALGFGDMRVVVEACFLLLALLLYVRTPRPWRFVVLLLLFVDLNFLLFAAGGVSDTVWVLLVVASIFAMRRPVLAGVLMGLAASFKQTPWLIAPFLLVFLLRTRPTRYVGRYAAGAAGAFLLLNLPFFVWGPRAWLGAVLAPFSGDQILYGSGLVLGSIQGWFPLAPRFFTLLELSAVAGLLAAYILWFDRLRHAFWVVPALVAFLGPRSLQNYFIFWVPVALAVVLAQPELDGSADRWASWWTPGRRRAATRVAAVFLALMLSGLAFAGVEAHVDAVDPNVEVRLDGSHINPDTGFVDRLTFSFVNHHPTPFIPHFLVRINNYADKVFEAAPGAEVPGNGDATITASARTDQDVFPAGAPLLVRITFPGHAEIVLARPEGLTGRSLINPEFRNWTAQGAPGWRFEPVLSPGGNASANLEGYEGFGTPVVVMRVDQAGYENPGQPYTAARLVQDVPWPDHVTLVAFPTFLPHEREGRPSVFQGLEINDGTHLTWFVLGAPDANFSEPPEAAYVPVAAPLHEWNEFHLNVTQVYERKGWPIPPVVSVVPLLVVHDLDPGHYEGAFAKVDGGQSDVPDASS